MNTFTSRLRQFVKSEDGISSVEYALMLAFVGGAIVVGATQLGTAVGTQMTGTAGCVSGTATVDATTGAVTAPSGC